jgi:hypothetical protein
MEDLSASVTFREFSLLGKRHRNLLDNLEIPAHSSFANFHPARLV